MGLRGNCYYAAEALYHVLGGKRAGWTPMVVRLTHYRNRRVPADWTNNTHWFLRHMILDPSVRQFSSRWFRKPDYALAKGCGFMTKRPSRGARALIEALTWQQ